MARERYPTTLGCEGTPHHPHELVTWLGTWIPREGDGTCEPPCWVCSAPGYGIPSALSGMPSFYEDAPGEEDIRHMTPRRILEVRRVHHEPAK